MEKANMGVEKDREYVEEAIRLLKALFSQKEDKESEGDSFDCDESYPKTDKEKVGCALYGLIASLKYMSATLASVTRADAMMRLNAPLIIRLNELRMVMENFDKLKLSIDDSYAELKTTYERTIAESESLK